MATFLHRLWLRTTHWIRACNPVGTGFVLLALAAPVHAQDVRFERVAEGVYAHVGDLGGRTSANQGLNASIGLVLTPGGAVLIDSGATARSARRIHEAVRQVTALPVKWVITTGGQDHRWLGNGYFRAQGVQLLAHARAEADMRNRDNDPVESLRAVLGHGVDGTAPVPRRRCPTAGLWAPTSGWTSAA